MRSRVVGRLSPAVLVPLALTALALTACGDDEPSGSSGGDETSAESSTAAPSTGPSATQSDAEPAVAPATGELVQLGSLSFRLSEGEWVTDQAGTSMAAVLPLEELEDLFTINAADIETAPRTLEEVKGSAGDRHAQQQPFLELQENRTVNGTEVFVYAGTDDDGRGYYEVGGLNDGQRFEILFAHPGGWDEAEQEVESILASIEWR